MDQLSLSMESVIELDRARNRGHDCVIKQDDIKRVEAEMVSAIGRFMPRSEGIKQWLRGVFSPGKRRRRFSVDELPEDLRRDVGLEAEADMQRGIEASQRRLLDRMRLGSI
ncbi:hypothetical protein D4A92_21035 [Rhizobium rosettiformans]|uniref:DUF1127 domain-containing protein n=1 Tax=Rhizobium rosettiformans TaxID=1368430 RepID=A0ABX7EZL0_9HYPH|nr:hypothetical protein D4A92_21035 [Rhizobium rosettiformans]